MCVFLRVFGFCVCVCVLVGVYFCVFVFFSCVSLCVCLENHAFTCCLEDLQSR